MIQLSFYWSLWWLTMGRWSIWLIHSLINCLIWLILSIDCIDWLTNWFNKFLIEHVWLNSRFNSMIKSMDHQSNQSVRDYPWSTHARLKVQTDKFAKPLWKLMWKGDYSFSTPVNNERVFFGVQVEISYTNEGLKAFLCSTFK